MRISMLSLMIVVLVAMLPGTSLAQDRQERVDHAADRGIALLAEAQRIQEALALTEAQQEELHRIMEGLRAENAVLMEELRSSDAYQAWQDSLRAHRTERMRERRQRGDREARTRERHEEMTPEEREEMRERREEMRQQRAERRRAPMARGLRGMPEAPAEVRELMREMRANTADAMAEAREVLTDEQYEHLQELMRETRRGDRSYRLRLRG